MNNFLSEIEKELEKNENIWKEMINRLARVERGEEEAYIIRGIQEVNQYKNRLLKIRKDYLKSYASDK